MINQCDRITLESNVIVRLVNPFTGAEEDRRESHNVWINQGRSWIRDLCAVSAFPTDDGLGDHNLTDNSGDQDQDILSVMGGATKKTYKPRYIGIGIGGALQTITPPGVGAQIEEVSVTKMEYPMKVTSSIWLKQILPQPDKSDPQFYPTTPSHSLRLRAIFDETDISFLTQEDGFGLDVPISEVGLFTSESASQTKPDNTGMIAYNTFSPISKTPNFVLEISWELRY